MGRNILARVRGLEPVATIVLHHHEHWDGSGYPSGLSGPKVPLASRIILAAEAYLAMTSPRPYRPAMTEGEARRELLKEIGRQFDVSVVRVLLDALDRRERSHAAARS